MPETKRPLKVFLCHASADKPKVRELYRTLKRRGILPWLDAENLIPGQNWEVEIPKALLSSDAIIICLSPNSVDKEGYVQKEIKFALDKALEMPEGRIFLIPARIEECDLPFSLRQYQAVNLYEKEGYTKLMKALKLRASQLERNTVELPKEGEIVSEIKKVVEEKKSVEPKQEKPEIKISEPLRETLSPNLDIGGFNITGGENVINIGIQEKSEPEKPTIEKSQPRNAKPPRKPNTAIIIALIGLAGTIIAALLGSPLIEKWFLPVAIPTDVASTATYTSSLPMETADTKGVSMRLVSSITGVSSFYFDIYEVSNEEYEKCEVCDSPLNQSVIDNADFANYPVVHVTWDMAKKFCEWRGAHLPTKSEWKLAAYGDTDSRVFSWGNEYGCDKANYGNCVGKTSQVDSFKNGISPFGIYNTMGNVWEWIDEKDPSFDGYYLVLGGSYNSGLSDLNAEKVVSNQDIYSGIRKDVGFRCAKDATP